MDKKIYIPLLLLIALLSVSFVSAADNVSCDVVSMEYNHASDFIAYVETNSNEVEDEILSSQSRSFTDLNKLINNNTNYMIRLEGDYTYNPSTDSQFVNGITITRSINIYGDGFTIDGNNKARIFNANSYVGFHNINFINGNSETGSAIYGTSYSVNNCNFTNNHATKWGGALSGGYARNCIFESNSASKLGGAIYKGSVENCTFKSNSASEGGAIYETYTTQSTFIENTALKYGGAMYGSSAGNSIFIRNSAKETAGAVYNAYVLTCTFINNTAARGGAYGGGSNSAQDCIFTGNYATEGGGAVFGASVVNSYFTANTAPKGGAMYTGSVRDCLFENNYASNTGGALMETYAVTSNFTLNNAREGGAMYQNSALSCNFNNNSAEKGGAIFNSHADKSKFYYNTAKQGGAIYEGGSQSSQFRYNSAVSGGAVYLTSLVACTLMYNTATDHGGAAYDSSSVRCYFEANQAKFGGAVSAGSASECTFKKNIAQISGGAKFNSYVADSQFEGNLPSYNLYASDFDGLYGFGGDIHINLYDNPKYPVTGVNATIKIQNSKNKVIGEYLSEVGYNWFVDLPAGKYKATISVEDESFEVDPIKININIKKASSIYCVDLTTNYNDGKVLIVNLHDAAGTVIKYAKITVVLDGVSKTYLTDENGQVMVPTKTLQPGMHDAEILFEGDNTYMESSANAKITIKKLTPKLTASKATLKLKDKKKQYTVTLKDNKNKVMKNIKITIKVNGKTYSAKTNAKGKATFQLKKLTKKGTYSATVKYSGSKIYNSVSKTVKITVKK